MKLIQFKETDTLSRETILTDHVFAILTDHVLINSKFGVLNSCIFFFFFFQRNLVRLHKRTPTF